MRPNLKTRENVNNKQAEPTSETDMSPGPVLAKLFIRPYLANNVSRRRIIVKNKGARNNEPGDVLDNTWVGAANNQAKNEVASEAKHHCSNEDHEPQMTITVRSQTYLCSGDRSCSPARL
jgi:hypothetical protein